MAMLLPDNSGIDKNRCVKMAIVHDLAESLAGDIAPSAKMSKEEKYRLEREAMETIVKTLNSSPEARQIQELWQEYEDSVTEEAQFVKDLDKFEMIVQAFEYEKSDGKKLDSFFESTRGKFTTDVVRKWVEALYTRRDAYWKEIN